MTCTLRGEACQVCTEPVHSDDIYGHAQSNCDLPYTTLACTQSMQSIDTVRHAAASDQATTHGGMYTATVTDHTPGWHARSHCSLSRYTLLKCTQSLQSIDKVWHAAVAKRRHTAAHVGLHTVTVTCHTPHWHAYSPCSPLTHFGTQFTNLLQTSLLSRAPESQMDWQMHRLG